MSENEKIDDSRETQEFIAEFTKYIRNETRVIRMFVVMMIIAGYLFFIGFGSQIIAQYIVLTIMLGLAYYLGRVDTKEKQYIGWADVYKKLDRIMGTDTRAESEGRAG